MAGEEKLQALINKLKKIDQFILKEADNIVEDNADVITSSARSNLKTGEDPEMNDIKYNKPRKTPLDSIGVYTAPYSKYKRKRGGKVFSVDLYLTGQFTGKIELTKMKPNLFMLASEDDKAGYIEGNYGDVVGVQDKKLQTLCDIFIAPELNYRIDRHLDE
jgi:hypothetical protein